MRMTGAIPSSRADVVPRKTSCSICKKPVPENSEAMPFCSKRCRVIDLGNWLGDKYRIPGESNVDEAIDAGDSRDSDAPTDVTKH